MSKLYLVPTPIGNLDDMTFRAINVLKEVDLILAEDTRTSGKLLKHYEIATHMQSHHMHNEHKTLDRIVQRLQSGELVSKIILRSNVFLGQQLLYLLWLIVDCLMISLFLKGFCP